MSIEALCICEVCCCMSGSGSSSWGCLFVVVECGDSKLSPAGDCDGTLLVGNRGVDVLL